MATTAASPASPHPTGPIRVRRVRVANPIAWRHLAPAAILATRSANRPRIPMGRDVRLNDGWSSRPNPVGLETHCFTTAPRRTIDDEATTWFKRILSDAARRRSTARADHDTERRRRAVLSLAGLGGSSPSSPARPKAPNPATEGRNSSSRVRGRFARLSRWSAQTCLTPRDPRRLGLVLHDRERSRYLFH
jgi:hypothetical protein